MTARLRVVTVVGTRPEIIRLSRTLPALDAAFDHVLVHTDQNHDRLLNQVFFEELGLRAPDRHLGVDTSSLGRTLGSTLAGIEEVLVDVRPHAMVVLGDTNASIAAVMARRLQVPVYHLEAGNRSFDANVPEEINRRLVDHVADFNLVYTEHARRNLLAEGLPARSVLLTGSPMAEVLAHHAAAIDGSTVLGRLHLEPGRYLVASAHREENVDEPDRLAALVRLLASIHRHFGLGVLVSTHPRTRKRLDALGADALDGVMYHEPFGFLDYAALQRSAYCVLSDSGTVSEESSLLGFPAVTLRNAIERPEALEAGAIVTTGLDPEVVIPAVELIVDRHRRGQRPALPPGYELTDFSQRVVTIIRSTAHAAHEWQGVRRRSAVWAGRPDAERER